MKIERISMVSGKANVREIDVTSEQLKKYEDGELIQVVMPHLTPGEREFIMTGITEEEWDATFPDE